MGEQLSLVWAIPFVGLLLSIGLGPLLAPEFWQRYFRHASMAWAALLAGPFLCLFREQAMHTMLHVLLLDYVPFIILLGSLYIVSGGILLKGTLTGTPWTNARILILGSVFASFVGTTGASMLFIRPLLRANAKRRYKVHTIVFFIFLVSNIAGCLTPLGDPPLFLGFLHGVPFFWTLFHLWQPTLVCFLCLLTMYVVLDWYWYSKESRAVQAAESREPLGLAGGVNVWLLAGILAGVLLSGYWKPTDLQWPALQIHNGSLVVLPDANGQGIQPDARNRENHEIVIPVQNVARDVILLSMAFLSLLLTPREIRLANDFSWGPISEVAWLFAGIFVTIIPVMAVLKAGEQGSLAFLVRAVESPAHYFWMSGLLSSFLDNAPTYLTFFATALGRFAPDQPERQAIDNLIANHGEYLAAISIGSVFMGANTYIGNAPNFIIRSIAQQAGIPMPHFFEYIYRYSLPLLIPTFVLLTVMFF